MYSNYGNPYGYGGGAYPTTPTYPEEQTISVISTAASSGHASLESSGSSHVAPPLPTEEDEGEGLGEEFERKIFPAKTKHFSLDSAYTSEVDLDSGRNTTATNSGTTSPKVSCDVDKKSHDYNATHPSEGFQDGDSPILQKLKKLSLGDNSRSPIQEDASPTQTLPPTSST